MLLERHPTLELLRKVSQYSGMRVLFRRLGHWAASESEGEPRRTAIAYVSPLSRSILDVGCGEAHYLASADAFKVGLDIWRPSLEKAKAFCSDVVQCDLREKLPFKDKAFDTVLGIEVIEHLEKDSGFKLLEELSRVAKREIILTAPRGLLRQYCRTKPYQTHRSGWVETELQSLGYAILRSHPIPPYTIYKRELGPIESAR